MNQYFCKKCRGSIDDRQCECKIAKPIKDGSPEILNITRENIIAIMKDNGGVNIHWRNPKNGLENGVVYIDEDILDVVEVVK
jgi:hypothetical protein